MVDGRPAHAGHAWASLSIVNVCVLGVELHVYKLFFVRSWLPKVPKQTDCITPSFFCACPRSTRYSVNTSILCMSYAIPKVPQQRYGLDILQLSPSDPGDSGWSELYVHNRHGGAVPDVAIPFSSDGPPHWHICWMEREILACQWNVLVSVTTMQTFYLIVTNDNVTLSACSCYVLTDSKWNGESRHGASASFSFGRILPPNRKPFQVQGPYSSWVLQMNQSTYLVVGRTFYITTCARLHFVSVLYHYGWRDRTSFQFDHYQWYSPYGVDVPSSKVIRAALGCARSRKALNDGEIGVKEEGEGRGKRRRRNEVCISGDLRYSPICSLAIPVLVPS